MSQQEDREENKEAREALEKCKDQYGRDNQVVEEVPEEEAQDDGEAPGEGDKEGGEDAREGNQEEAVGSKAGEQRSSNGTPMAQDPAVSQSMNEQSLKGQSVKNPNPSDGRVSPQIELSEIKRANQRSNNSISPSKRSRISLSLVPESKTVHARHYKSPKEYLGAFVQKHI